MCFFCCGKSSNTTDEDEEVGPNVRLLEPEEMSSDVKCVTKFVFIGDANSGKTSIIKKIKSNRFNESEISTVGMDFKVLYTEIDGNEHKLMLWDTPGQDRFSQIANEYYRGSDCFVIVYDLTSKASGKNIKKWLTRIESQLDSKARKPHRIVVGNKIDLGLRELDPNDLEEILDGVDHYIETSAKTGHNLDHLLKRMTIVADDKRRRETS